MSGSNYHLFKLNVQPMWEDTTNYNGGKWVVSLPKTRKEILDEYWLNTARLTVLSDRLRTACASRDGKGRSSGAWRRLIRMGCTNHVFDLENAKADAHAYRTTVQLLSVIGENFDEGDEICGAVVSIRKQQVRPTETYVATEYNLLQLATRQTGRLRWGLKQDKLALWTKTATNEAACMSIGSPPAAAPACCAQS